MNREEFNIKLLGIIPVDEQKQVRKLIDEYGTLGISAIILSMGEDIRNSVARNLEEGFCIKT